MIHRLLTRCPRRVLCTPAITRTGYSRYYARQVQKPTPNEPVTYWEKRVTVVGLDLPRISQLLSDII